MERRYSSSWALPRRNAVDPPEETIGENERLLALCSYAPVICLLPYLLDEGKSSYLSFHARQGFLLFCLEVLAGALFFIPLLGPPLALVMLIVLLITALWSVNYAAQKKCRSIPFLSPPIEEQVQ